MLKTKAIFVLFILFFPVYLYAGYYWTYTNDMPTSRTSHSATLLGNGNVFIAGGNTGIYGQNDLKSCIQYNPTTKVWSSRASMNTARKEHSAIKLTNGKVLVIGGSYTYYDSIASNTVYLSSCELYTPGTNTWTIVDSMNIARYGHSSILLDNGKVLVVGGGYNDTTGSSCEIYDPTLNTWTFADSLNIGRSYGFAIVKLANGNILITGGYATLSKTITSSCEIYNPTTNVWTITNSMATARYNHTATLLADGKVLIAGGYDANENSLSSCEIYDPDTGLWSSTSNLNSPRGEHKAILLSDGKVLVINGFSSPGLINTSCELYDSGNWTYTANINNPRINNTATLLANGKVLITGGYDYANYKYTSSCELFGYDNTSPTVTVVSPNNGENWGTSTTHNIVWTASDNEGIAKSKIFLSKDNGLNWSLITTITGADVSYSWTIPDTVVSNVCKIKVTVYDFADNTASDISDSLFIISDMTPPTVKIKSPNGNENWAGGTFHNIKWTAKDNVRIAKSLLHYSTNNGNSWVIIDTTYSDSVYNWAVPQVASKQSLIKITVYDNSNNFASDISDFAFTISDSIAPIVKLISPVGGENWAGKSTHNILWSATDVVGVSAISIYYSINHGNNWTLIDTLNSNPGSYNWKLPDVASTECLVRIFAYDSSMNFGSSISNLFTISDSTLPSVTVTYPNGGEVLICGNTYNIQWNPTDNIGISIDSVFYSIDNGISWIHITTLSSNHGSYNWKVPYLSSNKCLIKVIVKDFAGNKSSDISNSTFTIKDNGNPKITLTSPNGGENWSCRSYHNIIWYAVDSVGISAISLYYSINNGVNWVKIDSVNYDSSFYRWKIPDVISNQSLVKVFAYDFDGNMGTDLSNNTFIISDTTLPVVSVTSPNGGESWNAGSSHNITYTATDNIGIAKVSAYYTTNDTIYTKIDSLNGNPGTISWTLPQIVSNTVKVKIFVYDLSGNTSFDISNANFTIKDGTAPVVTVTFPNGGENLPAGSLRTITYTATDNIGITKVSFYYTSDGTNYTKIDSINGNPGIYNWTLPQVVTTNARVRVNCYDSANNKGSDISDAKFTIRDTTAPVVVVISPNGNEKWYSDSTRTITYTASDNIGIAKVSFYYTTDGIKYTKIDSVSGNPGSYNWTIPQLLSTSVKIKVNVYDDANNKSSDISNTDFTIIGGTQKILLIENFEGNWLPAGWTKENHGASTNNDWKKYYDENKLSNVAMVNWTPVEQQDEWLITPSLNCSNMSKVTLRFWHSYQDYGADKTDTGFVHISIDGGTTWNLITKFTEDNTGLVNLSLSSAVGKSNVKIRFRYVGNYDLYWKIDDIIIADAVPTSVNELPITNYQLPETFYLAQNYPNPFNPETVISYQLLGIGNQVSGNQVSGKQVLGNQVIGGTTDYRLPITDYHVKLFIYNITGQLVRTLVNEEQSPGYYSVKWDGKDSNGREVSSGLYIYTIKAGNFEASKKMIMVK